MEWEGLTKPTHSCFCDQPSLLGEHFLLIENQFVELSICSTSLHHLFGHKILL